MQLVAGCSLPSETIAGNSSIASLVLTSASAKLFELEAGKTETVSQSLTLQGAMGSLLKLRSTARRQRGPAEPRGEPERELRGRERQPRHR